MPNLSDNRHPPRDAEIDVDGDRWPLKVLFLNGYVYLKRGPDTIRFPESKAKEVSDAITRK
jgi:hypothetical protein